MVKSCQLFSKISSIEDARLGSKYTSSVKHQIEYFIKRTFRKYRSLEKADPGPLQKTHPMPKCTVLVNTLFQI